MSSQTFPRFLELPNELQMQIWKYAATPEGPQEQDSGLLTILYAGRHWVPVSFRGRRFTYSQRLLYSIITRPHYSTSEKVYNINEFYGIATTCEARFGLKDTCRLARQMALEAWKKDVKAVQLKPASDLQFWTYFRHTQHRGREKMELIQRKVGELLDVLIEAAKHGVAYDINGEQMNEQTAN